MDNNISHSRHDQLIEVMLRYDTGMAKQIQHFLKVYEFAHLIGTAEGLDMRTEDILETTAIVHDVGIREALKKYGSSDGKYQEELGPDEARPMLTTLGYDEDFINRVCYLIGHHHTYENMDGLDYQILVEADFLVNMYEDALSLDSIKAAYKRIFRTETGKKYCREMFGIKE
ncbi:MAG: HD domain-containing protein [Oribacterium sp.]|jgi:HD superfamily phosphodiesterase|nr:HD domain-containing protein [Oribacterium sp.]MDY6307912.1 HD domain-containing protein [Oribacterium sp.]MDY6316039.1 HD domain-containing protein [Oribacterium sp.]